MKTFTTSSESSVVREAVRGGAELWERNLRTVLIERERFVLVRRVLPGVLREELHPFATEGGQAGRARHAHHHGLLTRSLRARQNVAAVRRRVVHESSGSGAV